MCFLSPLVVSSSLPSQVRVGDYTHIKKKRARAQKKYERMTARAYIDLITKHEAEPGKPVPYLGNNKLPPHVAAALGVEAPPFYPKAHFLNPSLWFGTAGSVTPLHKDSPARSGPRTQLLTTCFSDILDRVSRF